MRYDAIVVGASVCGSAVAWYLAQRGWKVLVLERQGNCALCCAGLVSLRIKQMLYLPERLILNELDEAKFYWRGKFRFGLRSRQRMCVLDRHALNEWLASQAEGAGAKLEYGNPFLDVRIGKGVRVESKRGVREAEILIGADGPCSSVVERVGIKRVAQLLLSAQSRVRGEFDCVELWFDVVFPNFFAWVVPESKEIARVGVAPYTPANFKHFMRLRLGRAYKAQCLGHLIFGSSRLAKGRVALVGCAACMTKPFSAGGIVYGLIGSKACAKACDEVLKTQQYELLESAYERALASELKPAIRRGMLLRRAFFAWPALWLYTLSVTGLHRFLSMLDVDLLKPFPILG